MEFLERERERERERDESYSHDVSQCSHTLSASDALTL